MKNTPLVILIGLLIGIVGSFCIGTTSALTPEGVWGISAGDELFYKMTLKDGPFEVMQYEKISITKIQTNTITFLTTEYDCNFVYAITYVYNGTEWIESNAETEWVGYNNNTHQYYGGLQLCLGFPRPSFLPFDLEDVWDTMNYNASYTGWGPYTIMCAFIDG